MVVPAGTEPLDGLETISCRRFENRTWETVADLIAPETTLSLHWPGREPTVLNAFPHRLEDLALGHALLEFCGQDQVPVLDRIAEGAFFLSPQARTRGADRSGDALSAPRLAGSRVLALMKEFIEHPGRWDSTGCFHKMAVLDPEQDTFLFRVEDIGRHNCVDRVAALLLDKGLDADRLALFVSARATASLVGKIVKAGFRILVSRSAVTMAGVDAARASGLSLAGFARKNRVTVFTDEMGRFQ